MNLAIVGSRSYDNYSEMKQIILEYFGVEKIDNIVSGCARGADELGVKFADEFGINIIRFPANWNIYGKNAGHIRNKDIVKNADHIIAFWDCYSIGTKHTIKISLASRVPVTIIPFKKEKEDITDFLK